MEFGIHESQKTPKSQALTCRSLHQLIEIVWKLWEIPMASPLMVYRCLFANSRMPSQEAGETSCSLAVLDVFGTSPGSTAPC